jgi:glycosyltransferase involved in cell wall biosynthesis
VELIHENLSIKPKGLKIGLIGSCPPPYSGIAVHIQRLMKKLDDSNINYVLYDILGVERKNEENRIVCIKYPKLWIIKYFFSTKNEITHNHTEHWGGQIIVGLMGLLGKKTIATLHSEVLINSWRDYNFIKRKVIQIALKSTTSLIVVNSNIKDFCLSLGIDQNKIFLIPAFIPPTLEKEEINEIPRDIWNFIDTHYPILSGNAYKITFLKDEDVYGIDICIELCFKLKQTWNDVGLIFFLPEFFWEKKEKQYFSYLQQRIIELELQNNFLFVTQSYPFHPILLRSTVFIRPTNTDGDAISIREALYFGVPAVASNVVTRPEGTIVFKNRDIDDFTLKVKDLLDNYQYHKQILNSLTFDDNASRILQVYQRVSGMSDTVIAD